MQSILYRRSGERGLRAEECQSDSSEIDYSDNCLCVCVCVGQIRQRRISRSDKLEQYSIYVCLHCHYIYSPMIDSAHVLSELRLDLLHDDLHRVY